ncbi:MAG: sodium:solute symporter family protein [Candidatus Omnitrophica bacterium]|nr:sodium:solute symporter family protein [Candidatus Omnitrophota bacterium]
MTFIDFVIVFVYLVATLTAGIMVRKYVGKVEHFIVAGREMNLYLGIASLAATEFGIITCMYTAQNGYDKGFSGAAPGVLTAIAMFVVGWTGFCIKPMRDAGVMTIPELFQIKFGSRIRWLAGVVIVLGGLLNMGVFLRVGGEFLVVVCGIELHYLVWMMTAMLILVAFYTILGGMLSVLVTDFLQFLVMSVGMLLVTLLILYQVGWSALVDAVTEHHGTGGFNPVTSADAGWPYVIFNGMLALAIVLTWQTNVQRLLSSKDTKTGQRIYMGTSFFFVCRFLLPAVWGIAALAMLTPDQQEGIKETTQLAMPMFLATAVPAGLMGILIAAMLAADMSTDAAYMLTWASVIYNDILAGWRKRRNWTDAFGIFVNRMIIACIGLFLLVFGLWYQPNIPIWDYLTVTGTIYLSSMSVLMVACCYWKGANNWGATGAIFFGAVTPLAYLVMEKMESTADFAEKIGPHYSGILTFLLVAAAMVLGSLLKPAERSAS